MRQEHKAILKASRGRVTELRPAPAKMTAYEIEHLAVEILRELRDGEGDRLDVQSEAIRDTVAILTPVIRRLEAR